MKQLGNKYIFISLLFFLIIVILAMIKQNSIADFGNYYYGSKLFFDGKFDLEYYKDIALFNSQIGLYGEINYFENYIPVPPFSLLFYLPCVFFKAIPAKLFFVFFSLLLFSISYKRLCYYLNFRNWQLILLPICLFYPLYNNALQGQTYILITALLIEVFLLSEKQKDTWASLLLAISISLKLFPVFFIVYFIFQKRYKVVLCTILFCLIIYGITAFLVGVDLVVYYFKNIVPRLINNDIVGAYYHGNQSIYTMLLNLFSYDALENTKPLINYKYLVIALETIFVSLALFFLFHFPKQNRFLFFGIVCFMSFILGRYNTSYSMLMLLPIIIYMLKEKKYIILALIALAISLPIGYFKDGLFILQYSRIILLLIVFAWLWKEFEVKIKLQFFTIVFLTMLFFKYISYPIKACSYFNLQNSKGVLYDYQLNQDSITLISTIGHKNIEETFYLKTPNANNQYLSINGHDLYYKNTLIDNYNDNKQKPFILNDTTVIFMSDLNQGIRFYKLRIVKVR